MRLGIVSDIHEEVHWLGRALEILRQENVDRVVLLGDVFRMGDYLEETVTLLAGAGAIGVWGNHDFGLSYQPKESLRAAYAGPILDFMSTLHPRLEIGDLLFSHVEPWLDPTDLMDLWYFGGIPDTPEKLARSFHATGHRVMFVGHFHRWLVGTSAGLLPWSGEHPIHLAPEERYLVVMGPLCEGRFGIFDTGANVLMPYNLGDSR
jgi:calcineurin-like phosphoesterase family protein